MQSVLQVVNYYAVLSCPSLSTMYAYLLLHSFLVDITVDDIIDEIARRLHGNFGGLDRSYAVEVTSQNFLEIVKTPKQNVLLLTYDKSM